MLTLSSVEAAVPRKDGDGRSMTLPSLLPHSPYTDPRVRCHSKKTGQDHKELGFGPALRWMTYEAAGAGLRIRDYDHSQRREPDSDYSLRWAWVVLEFISRSVVYEKEDSEAKVTHTTRKSV